MEISCIYNKSNPWGIQEDVALVTSVLKPLAGRKIREADPLEPPVKCDLAIHFEVPAYVWMPYAAYNIVIVNPEWWEAGWNGYLDRIDCLLFKCESARQLFLEMVPGLAPEKTAVLPWATNAKPVEFGDRVAECVWFLGGSRNKITAAERILPWWTEEMPAVHVYCNQTICKNYKLASNVHIEVGVLDKAAKAAASKKYETHLVFSCAEGFGHVVAEAEMLGARIIGNNLPVYSDLFLDSMEVLNTDIFKDGLTWRARFSKREDFVKQFLEVYKSEFSPVENQRRAMERCIAFCRNLIALFNEIKAVRNKVKHYPPVLVADDCPPISVVTLLYNRRNFFELACHNLLATDYPLDKIEWIIVEDTQDPAEQCSDKIVKFTEGCSLRGLKISIAYVPLDKKHSIGSKRNLGIDRATSDIILMMDDDDCYPSTSFRRRVAWLTKGPWTASAASAASSPECCVATTIACYDLKNGVSSINTPPLTLGLAGRCSEATLTFYRRFWSQRKFPDSEMGEGEGFLSGREGQVLELAPQQIIVAFSHSKNASGRRAPEAGLKAGCFWGFPKEYLEFIHGLEGVAVEAE